MNPDFMAGLLEVGEDRRVERVPLGDEIPDGAEPRGFLEATNGVDVADSFASFDVVAEDDAVARSPGPKSKHRNVVMACGRHRGAHDGRTQIVERRVYGPGWEPRSALRPR